MHLEARQPSGFFLKKKPPTSPLRNDTLTLVPLWRMKQSSVRRFRFGLRALSRELPARNRAATGV